MPKLKHEVYVGHSTSGAAVVEQTTDPSSNLAGMMRNNAVVFESRVQLMGALSPAAEPVQMGRRTYLPAAGHRGYEFIGAAELEGLLENHLDRLDDVFRRLS